MRGCIEVKMNVLNFIDSPDIKDYLSDIGYEFSVPELAFLVYMSRKATLRRNLKHGMKL